GEAQRAGGLARVHLRGHHRAGPAAYSSHDRDILPAVGTAIADRLADDPAARLELPHDFAGARVHGFEPAVHRPVEDETAGGRKRRTPYRQVFRDFPDLA